MKKLFTAQKGFLSFIELVIALPIMLLLLGGTFGLIQVPLAKRDLNKTFFDVLESPILSDRFPAGHNFVPTPTGNIPSGQNPVESGVLTASTASSLFNDTICQEIQSRLNTETSPFLLGISQPGRVAVQLAFVRFIDSNLTLEFIAKTNANSGICNADNFAALSSRAGELDWKAVADNLKTAFAAQSPSLRFGLVPVVGTSETIPSTWLIAVALMEVSQPMLDPFGSGNRIVSAVYVKPAPNPAAFQAGNTYAP